MSAKLSAKVLISMSEITSTAWDSVVNAEPKSFNPFLSHAFLSALETSGSATARTGWQGHHVVLQDGNKTVSAVPCYAKSHSQGEYVFDHGWGEAFARAGGRYYPKLQVSVPFSPIVARKLSGTASEALAKTLVSACEQAGCSSVHATFVAEDDAAVFRADSKTWLERHDIQFHWYNNEYSSFDEFLSALSSSKRKNIRKERQAVVEAGITFQRLTGDAIEPRHWDAFWTFYMDTGSRKWGRPYLTRKFFELIHNTMRQHILLVMAFRGSKPIAGALNFIGGDTLYGRNWGCTEQLPFLHFETCYYQAINFAIERKLRVIEAGAQGEHKLARGYVPVKTMSFHHLAHPGLARAVADYLEHERASVASDQSVLAAHAPFRQTEQE